LFYKITFILFIYYSLAKKFGLTERKFVRISTPVFLAVAILQFFRALKGSEFNIIGWEVPIPVSIGIGGFAFAMSAFGFSAMHNCSSAENSTGTFFSMPHQPHSKK